MFAYLVKLAIFNTENLKSEIIPGDSKTINKISFFEANESETKELLSECKSYLNQ